MQGFDLADQLALITHQVSGLHGEHIGPTVVSHFPKGDEELVDQDRLLSLFSPDLEPENPPVEARKRDKDLQKRDQQLPEFLGASELPDFSDRLNGLQSEVHVDVAEVVELHVRVGSVEVLDLE